MVTAPTGTTRGGLVAIVLAALVLATGAGCGVDSDEPRLADDADTSVAGDGADAGGCQAIDTVDPADAPEVSVPAGEPPDELVTEDLVVGDGREVAAGDQVQVQYTGVLHDTGEEFDTSWDDLQPLTFQAGMQMVIPGFDEGVLGMAPGGRRQITIPPALGYGDQGAGDAIPPGATLVFVVDLVEVCPASVDPAPTGASTVPAEPAAASDVVTLPPGPPGRTLDGPTPCPATDGSEERVASFAEPPPTCIQPGEPLVAEIAITTADEAGAQRPFGTIVVELDTEAAPVTANNFVVLARYGFYDGIPFHRLVPDFVAQVGGSGAPGPDGAPDYGSTGPGYDGQDVEHPTDGYAVGDVAMARSEAVSGSQLFIVTDEAGLPGLDQAGTYPRFGRVTEGLELAVEMANDGDGATNGTPRQLYTIESLTIR